MLGLYTSGDTGNAQCGGQTSRSQHLCANGCFMLMWFCCGVMPLAIRYTVDPPLPVVLPGNICHEAACLCVSAGVSYSKTAAVDSSLANASWQGQVEVHGVNEVTKSQYRKQLEAAGDVDSGQLLDSNSPQNLYIVWQSTCKHRFSCCCTSHKPLGQK